MSFRVIIPNCPNCGNGSVHPSLRTSKLRLLAGIGRRQHVPIDTLRLRSPAKVSALRWTFGPLRAAEDLGAVGELSATEESFYELLGIPVSGSLDDIKRAYKQLVRKYHPDVSPPDRAEEYTQRFIRVQEAYETLSDPECRALYDRHLARGLQFAFSARRKFDVEREEKYAWKKRWQDQLVELSRKRMMNNSDNDLSWGARMRRKRAEMSAS